MRQNNKIEIESNAMGLLSPIPIRFALEYLPFEFRLWSRTKQKKIYCSAQIDFDVIFLLIRTFQCIYFFFQSWRHKSNFNLWKFMRLYNSCWLNWQQIAWIYKRMNKRKTIQFRKLWVCSRNHQSGNLFTVSSCVRLDLLNNFFFLAFDYYFCAIVQ